MVIEKTSVGLSQMFLLYWHQFWHSLFCPLSLMLCESSCDWAEASGDAMVSTRSRGFFMAVVSLGVIAICRQSGWVAPVISVTITSADRGLSVDDEQRRSWSVRR